MAKSDNRTAGILKKHERELLSEWVAELKHGGAAGDSRISEKELFEQAGRFLSLMQQAAHTAGVHDTDAPQWDALRTFLEDVSRSRVQQGFSSDQTARFIFSFKKPLFARLRTELGDDAKALAEETWAATDLLDRLGMYTVKAFQKTREDVINRQQQEMLELSTPVVKLWEGILALPMIGTLDSARTQVVMESLLQKICLLYTSPSPRDGLLSRMPSSA